MKISSHQAQILFQIAFDTVNIKGYIGGINQADRLNFVNELLNQQDRTIINLEDNDSDE